MEYVGDKFLETPNNSRLCSYEVKEEELEDVKFNLEDLHHSIDIKEDDIEELTCNSSNVLQYGVYCSTCISDMDQQVLSEEPGDVLQNNFVIKKEEVEDAEFNPEDLHHSIDIKEESESSDADMDQQVHSEEPGDVLPNNFIIKKEEVEDAEFNPEDLHHSIDIKEESESSDADMNKTLTYEEFQNLESSRVLESQENGVGNLHLNLCPICRYKYIHEEDFRIHLITHIAKKFACEICDYKCNRRSGLKVHLRTHTGETPFACKICDYKCKQKSNLKVHVRTHTGEKPFSCTLCDYKCKQKSSLKVHVRTHTGEKPFSCTLCDYKCKQKSGLTVHLRTHQIKSNS